MALAGVTDQIVYLEEGDLVDLQLGRYWIVAQGAATRQALTPAERPCAHRAGLQRRGRAGPVSPLHAKEIFEQPRAIADTLEGVEGIVPELFDGAGLHGEPGAAAWRVFKEIDNVPSYPRHQLLQRLHRQVLAGRHRGHSHPGGSGQRIPLPHQRAQPAHPGRHHQPKRRNRRHPGRAAPRAVLGMQHTLTICNVATSAMVRECKLAYITRAGVEIGVASTKAFTTQLAGLFLLTLALAQSKGRLTEAQEAEHLKAMRHLPVALQAVLALEPQLISWAEDFARMENALFLGRGLHSPHRARRRAQAHGNQLHPRRGVPGRRTQTRPSALVTSSMPVVTVAPNDALLEKLKSNMQEVRARAGVLYVLADADTHIESAEGLHVIRMPEHYGALSPLLHVVPLQLLAYHTACARGRMWTSLVLRLVITEGLRPGHGCAYAPVSAISRRGWRRRVLIGLVDDRTGRFW